MPENDYARFPSIQRPDKMIENYIYLYHLDTFVVLPTYPESISETLNSTFAETSILARSAPIYSYSYSGPRTITFNLYLHRDMMTQINYGTSKIKVEIGDDYVDTIIKQLQAVALPKYAANSKMVNPPMVAVRLGNDLFIKGVVNGGITTTYSLPILSNGKYAQVQLSFTVSEVDPYDAETVVTQGGLRGLSRTLERNLFKTV